MSCPVSYLWIMHPRFFHSFNIQYMEIFDTFSENLKDWKEFNCKIFSDFLSGLQKNIKTLGVFNFILHLHLLDCYALSVHILNRYQLLHYNFTLTWIKWGRMMVGVEWRVADRISLFVLHCRKNNPSGDPIPGINQSHGTTFKLFLSWILKVSRHVSVRIAKPMAAIWFRILDCVNETNLINEWGTMRVKSEKWIKAFYTLRPRYSCRLFNVQCKRNQRKCAINVWLLNFSFAVAEEIDLTDSKTICIGNSSIAFIAIPSLYCVN